jgi:hypothetical protein
MRRIGAVGVLVLAAGLTAGGCQEKVCRDGERPVRSVSAPDTGRACVPDGQPAPAGYEDYPPGQAPVYVDD